MDLDFWRERWQQGQIGFHQTDYNPHLTKHWPALLLHGKGSVFVPLCGKSRDMLWLREQGHSVIGIEGSEIAIADFIREAGGKWTVQQQGPFLTYTAPGITLLQGDFFDLTSDDLAAVRGVYDRAAMVAFPHELRRRYQQRLIEILPPATKILLITMEYDSSLMSGPPFAVMVDEVNNAFGNAFAIEDLEQVEVLELNPRFQERGLTWLRERCIFLSKY